MSRTRPDVRLEIDSFADGFLDSPEEDSLPPGATRDAKNMLLIRVQRDGRVRAILRKRLGSRLVNPTAIAAGKAGDGIFAYEREDGDSELIVMVNGALYKWDGTTGFTALTDGGGFTAGNRATALQFKNNLIVMDGSAQKRYDGTACLDVGADRDEDPPTLAAGAGTGLTGTYEGYWVGYDPAMDHETSPSEVSAAVALANQDRSWTQPAHALPAHYTHWRVYCRRTDTNEANFFRVFTEVIGTTVVTESISDAARRDPGPAPNSNDKPPVFAFAAEHLGYRLGFPANSSDMYVSKLLDPESQHPRDVFPIGGKGDTKPVRSAHKVGEEFIVAKPTRSYRLEGDRSPFTIRGIKSSLGAVSARSGVEVGDWWYDWDGVKGPYRTNTVQWETLGDARIERILATINRQALHLIECAHYKTLSLILWAIPTTSTRKRTILPYHTTLGRWLPPITGLEYSALTQFTTPDGDYGVYFADEWGRVWELFSGERDGPADGDTEATITAATAGTITAAGAAFSTTGSGLAGVPALVVSPAGVEQWVRIASNTATVLTLDTTNGPSLSPVPDPTSGTWRVIIGGIDWYWWTPRFTGGDPFTEKSRGWFYLQAGVTSADHELRVDLRFNRAVGIRDTFRFTFTPSGLVWGVGQWGEDPWGDSGERQTLSQRMPRAYFDAAFRFSNYYPDQPIEIAWVRCTADWLRAKKVPAR